MMEQKFYRAGIVLGVLSLVCTIFEPIIGVLFAIVSIVCNVKNKENYRIRIGIACSVAALVLGVVSILFMIWAMVIMPGSMNDYWIFKIFQ